MVGGGHGAPERCGWRDGAPSSSLSDGAAPSSGRPPRVRAMTTARTVPVTTEMDGDELDALDAWHLARRHGLRAIAVESFVRFRYGDGFTNSRALALQACLAVVPFLLALTGLAADLDEERPAAVVAHVVDSLSPGAGDSDALASAVEQPDESEEAGEVALVLGLGFALLSMTTAMAQVERGANRIYGIRRDRKARREVRPRGRADGRAGRAGRRRLRDDRRRRCARRGDGRQLRLVRHDRGLVERAALAGRSRPARPHHRRPPRPRAAPSAAGAVVAGAGLGDRGAC